MSAMTLSLLGRAMLLAGCTAAGFYLAGRAGRRRKELLLAASFLGEVCSRLAFCLQPAGELIAELGKEEAFRSLPCLQLFLRRGETFPKGWRAAVMDCGGELQRAALARVLVLSPEILVLDEPTSMLDVITQAQMVRLLREYQAAHDTAYIFITHNRTLCDSLCSRVYHVEQGIVEEEGVKL